MFKVKLEKMVKGFFPKSFSDKLKGMACGTVGAGLQGYVHEKGGGGGGVTGTIWGL
jgi:hypothetical protein